MSTLINSGKPSVPCYCGMVNMVALLFNFGEAIIRIVLVVGTIFDDTRNSMIKVCHLGTRPPYSVIILLLCQYARYTGRFGVPSVVTECIPYII